MQNIIRALLKVKTIYGSAGKVSKLLQNIIADMRSLNKQQDDVALRFTYPRRPLPRPSEPVTSRAGKAFQVYTTGTGLSRGVVRSRVGATAAREALPPFEVQPQTGRWK